MDKDTRIPIILLTGFLGSGKTTLLNHILRDPQMAASAVLINEIGAVGLDHLLVERVSEEVILLESGCLCCSVRGDLVRSLRDLFMRRLRREIPQLDRVVIETTGLADPAPVIHTLIREFFLAERFRLEGVVTTVDVQHVHWQLAQHVEAVRQVVMADRIVLTKCDLADSLMIAEADERLAELNPAAPCWHSTSGTLPPGLLEGMSLYDPAGRPPDVARWLGEAAILEQQRLHEKMSVFGATSRHPIHSDDISTHVLRFSQPLIWADFSRALDTLQSVLGEHILRVKGLIAVVGEDRPRVIHAVQHERYPDSWLAAWPDEDRSSRLVLIVSDLPRAVLEKAFAAFCGVDSH
jgi:G3E family GTPase